MPRDLGGLPERHDRQSEIETYEFNEVQQERIDDLLRQVFRPAERSISQYEAGSEPHDTEYGRCVMSVHFSSIAERKVVQAAIRDEEGDTYFLQHAFPDDAFDAERRPHECNDNCFCAGVTEGGVARPFLGYDTENNIRELSQDQADSIVSGMWAMCNDIKYSDPTDRKSTNARVTIARLDNFAPRDDIPLTYHPAFLVAMKRVLRHH
jgi:hypothetical protein